MLDLSLLVTNQLVTSLRPPGNFGFRMSADDTLRLVRSGHDPVDILVNQVTPAAVARVFSVRKRVMSVQ